MLSLTPYALQFLIHTHTTPEPWSHNNGLLHSNLTNNLEKDAVISRTSEGSGWELTEKGVTWLDMILATPMPIANWKDPRDYPPRITINTDKLEFKTPKRAPASKSPECTHDWGYVGHGHNYSLYRYILCGAENKKIPTRFL